MKKLRLYTLLALLLMTGGVTMKAQEPVEIFESPVIIAYHFCQWDDGEVLLNAKSSSETTMASLASTM